MHMHITCTGTPEWDSFISEYMQAWKERIINWLIQDHAKVHVVYYEDLLVDKLEEIIKILDFLNVEYLSADDVWTRVSDDFTEFKRSHVKRIGFQYYTLKQTYFIRAVIQDTKELVRREQKSLELDRYMQV